MNEFIKQLSSGNGTIIVIALAVLFIAWKIVIFIHPHISNKEEVTDISGSVKDLEKKSHEQDIRLTKVEEHLKYVDKELDRNSECNKDS